MNNDLFDNVGKYLKDLAKGVYTRIFTLYILIGAAIAICGIVLVSNGMGWGILGLFIAAAVIGYGNSAAKLTVAKLYAYGEIADRLITIDSKLSSYSSTASTASSAENKKAKVKSEKTQEPIDHTPRRTAPWVCHFCGCTNPSDARFCNSCSTEDIGV